MVSPKAPQKADVSDSGGRWSEGRGGKTMDTSVCKAAILETAETKLTNHETDFVNQRFLSSS